MAQKEPAELLAEIEAVRAPVVLDVRSGWEFRSGHVPGAMHMPFWAAAARLSRIPARREDPVVVTCEHGPRALVAMGVLRLAGFRRVLYLQGQMTGWKKAGHRLEHPGGPGAPDG